MPPTLVRTMSPSLARVPVSALGPGPRHPGDAEADAGLVTPLTIFPAGSVRLWLRWTSVLLGTPPAIATAADQSGLGNDASQGTVADRPTLVDGVGMDFDGTDDHLVVASDASLDLTTKMTIGLRLKFDTVVADQVVMSKMPSSGGSWVLQFVGSQSRLWVRFADSLRYGRLSAMAAGTNYSIVIVYDGDQLVANNRMLAWVNGTQDSGISYTSTIPTSLPVTAHDVVIGRWLNDLQKFNGTMRAAFIAAAAATPAQMPRIFSYLDGC